jgi:hypothetical protein
LSERLLWPQLFLDIAEDLSDLGKKSSDSLNEVASKGGVGGKFWLLNDSDDGSGILLGLNAHYSLSDQTYILAGAYAGEVSKSIINPYGDEEDLFSMEYDLEAAFVYQLDFVDVGIGYRYTTYAANSLSQNEVDGTEYNEYVGAGPMFFVGRSGKFGELPFGWYGGGSWMFYDMVKDNEAGLEHVVVEFGLLYEMKKISLTAGYRYKTYLASETDYSQNGFTGGVSYDF